MILMMESGHNLITHANLPQYIAHFSLSFCSTKASSWLVLLLISLLSYSLVDTHWLIRHGLDNSWVRNTPYHWSSITAGLGLLWLRVLCNKSFLAQKYLLQIYTVLKTNKCVLLYFVDTNNFSGILCRRSLLNLLTSVVDLKGHPILMLSLSQYKWKCFWII